MRHILPTLLLLTLAACGPSSKEKLAGTWQQIGADTSAPDLLQTYRFEPGGRYGWFIQKRSTGDTSQKVTGTYDLKGHTLHVTDDDTVRHAEGSVRISFPTSNRLRMTEQDARKLSFLYARVDSVRK